MKTLFVGIDISKDSLDVSVCCGASKEVKHQFCVMNTHAGISKLIKQCYRQKSDDDHLWVCFEHTGNYGWLLCALLQKAQIPYSAVAALEIIQSQGMTRGKSDTVDADRIAVYAATHSHKLTPCRLPSETLLKIKMHLAQRDRLVKQRSAQKNALKNLKISHLVVDVSDIIEMIQQHLKYLSQLIDFQDRKVKQLIESDELLKVNYNKITQIKGVGSLIAAHIILYTNNFTSFENPRKFNCFSGLAPFKQSSGSSMNKPAKTSRLRNKKLKALLFNGANTAANYDDQMKKYYQRKKLQGKHHNSIINAIACKLVYRIFAVVKRDEPYVEFSF